MCRRFSKATKCELTWTFSNQILLCLRPGNFDLDILEIRNDNVCFLSSVVSLDAGHQALIGRDQIMLCTLCSLYMTSYAVSGVYESPLQGQKLSQGMAACHSIFLRMAACSCLGRSSREGVPLQICEAPGAGSLARGLLGCSSLS